ncbi:pectinesterase-like [Lolium rigidum]|uniref:pectinesterase-like n=1 Tax=Lolium rigidum TaxID=89674 RepID=UPI001F5C2473|nr:pectinesterase-like [Lolium rigidum]
MAIHGTTSWRRWLEAIATVLALATLAAAVAAGKQQDTTSKAEKGSATVVSRVSRIATSAAAAPASLLNVTDLCSSTPYPGACRTAMSSSASRSAKDPFAASVQFAMARAASARALARNLSSASSGRRRGALPPSGMDDCAELLDISHVQLGDALAAGSAHDATTWLSAALTNQGTCGDSLAAVPATTGREGVRRRVGALSEYIGTALALHAKFKGGSGTTPPPPPSAASTPSSSPPNRRFSPPNRRFPSWVSDHDRKLLESTVGGLTPDAVVALDGSGTHGSIGEAITAVTAALPPVGSSEAAVGAGRKVIYVKAGRYEESVRISSKQKDVMLMGDGKGKTIIVGHRSVADGYTTYDSATVAAMGSGFIAKGLTIINDAGPSKGQAVALRVGGDLSVVYQCDIEAYQDTLYVYSNRQFYSEDSISGTVDFIFGNSAVVIQNCDIRPRKPNSSQKDTITAQGRTDPNQNTGISIHKCRITSTSDIGDTKVYLGRPWKKYSRTVVMESSLDRSITPSGWLEWSGQFALSTLYYGEYDNTGPGAVTSGRVKWSGLHTSMSAADATRFTVRNFILGDSWLGNTGVSYTSGL